MRYNELKAFPAINDVNALHLSFVERKQHFSVPCSNVAIQETILNCYT